MWVGRGVYVCVKNASEWPGLCVSLFLIAFTWSNRYLISERNLKKNNNNKKKQKNFGLLLMSYAVTCPVFPNIDMNWNCFFAPVMELAVVKSYVPMSELGKSYSLYLFIYFCLLGPHLQYMEVPRLGVKSELQLPAHTTATAAWDPSRVCDLHHSSRQRQILNPLSEARDWTRVLIDTSWIHYSWATAGTPCPPYLDALLISSL